MRVAVVGLGSIGLRHARNLVAMADVDVVAVRSTGTGNALGVEEVRSLEDARADAFIVCSPTARHAEVLERVAEFAMPVLCEKPLVATQDEANRIVRRFSGHEAPLRVAFNMRFHPLVRAAQQWMTQGTIGDLQYARFSVGQYLPDWRPEANYLESYSARAELGGGVALDLIHEMDLADLFAGRRTSAVAAVVARVGSITVDTEDLAEIAFRADRGAVVSVHLDYLQRGYQRSFSLLGSGGTIQVDIAAGIARLMDSNGVVVRVEDQRGFERNRMYQLLLDDFFSEVRGTNPAPRLPSFAESLRALITVFEAKGSQPLHLTERTPSIPSNA